MSKPTVHMMTGLPASGKSTFARTLKAARFNLDDMRAMQGFGIENRHLWTRNNEDAVKEALIRGVVATVDSGLDVVVDNTHLTAKFPRAIRDRLHGKAVFEVHSFLDVPIEVCIERDSQRAQPVGETVIRNLAKSHHGAIKNGWRLDKEWLNIWPDVQPYIWTPGLPNTIIVDLDGTIALHTNRGPYDAAKCYTDDVCWEVYDMVAAWSHSNQHSTPIFLSGRSDEFREETQRWINDRLAFSFKAPLYMRAAGDVRPDYVVKYELFNNYIRGKFNVHVAFDDRDQIVALWRQTNIKTFQVNEGNF